MKKTSLTLLPVIAGLFAACESMNAPVSSGGFDPLRPPGSEIGGPSESGPRQIRPGEFVIAAVDNTAFFNTRPRGDAEADKLLSRGTSMRVIAVAGSYYRVELDSGEVGFVPSVMVEDPNAMPDMAGDPMDMYSGMIDVTPADTEPVIIEPLPDADSLPAVIEPEIEPSPMPTEITPGDPQQVDDEDVDDAAAATPPAIDN